jgi:hypothetical protein
MTEPESSSPRAFVLPADYYSSPAPASVLPRGCAFGCGAASIVVLLFIFIGGALVSGGGFASFMDFAMGMSIGQMRGMYAGDVPDARQKSLEAEIDKMRANVRSEKVSVAALQPFMEQLRTAIEDKKVTAEEAAKLEESARKINGAAKR